MASRSRGLSPSPRPQNSSQSPPFTPIASQSAVGAPSASRSSSNQNDAFHRFIESSFVLGQTPAPRQRQRSATTSSPLLGGGGSGQKGSAVHGPAAAAGSGSKTKDKGKAGEYKDELTRLELSKDQVGGTGSSAGDWAVLRAVLTATTPSASGSSPHQGKGKGPAEASASSDTQQQVLSPKVITEEPDSYTFGNGSPGGTSKGGSTAAVENMLRGMGEEEAVDTTYASQAAARRKKKKQGGAGSDSSDSDSDSDSESRPAATSSFISRGLRSFRQRLLHPPALTTLQKDIFKCGLAYYLAQLFTYNSTLARLIGAPLDASGPVRNAHVIATITVFFHPAKSAGAMVEADLFLAIAAVYAVFLSVGSMAMTALLDSYGLMTLAHFLVLTVWLGGGYGLLAYVKLTRNKPTLSTACSVVSLVASVIITKEGAFHVGLVEFDMVAQVTILLLVGATITNVVCFGFWRRSATVTLRAEVGKTLGSFSTLLALLTKTFLLDHEISTRPETVQKAIDAHQSSFTSLKQILSHAKFEPASFRHGVPLETYSDIVASSTRLAQGLNRMRAGCLLQYDLMSRRKDVEEGQSQEAGEEKKLVEDGEVFDAFRERVGESLRALTTVSRKTLALLKGSFFDLKGHRTSHHHHHSGVPVTPMPNHDLEAGGDLLTLDKLVILRDELEEALIIFQRSHSKAIKILYRKLPAPTPLVQKQDPFLDPVAATSADADEESADGPNEDLFRLYFFCFNLEEWIHELSHVVDLFIHLRGQEADTRRRQALRREKFGWFARFVPMGWAGVNRGRLASEKSATSERVDTFRLAIAEVVFSKKKRAENPFPDMDDPADSSHRTREAKPVTWAGKAKRAIWKVGRYFRQPDVKFALKTGAGVALLAAPAFVQSYRPLWLRWRGEWALISYMVIMSQTVGGTSFLAFTRVVGTFVGAVAGVGCYLLFPENGVVLPILGVIFSLPCFWVVITKPAFGPSSRFVLLTFNLTCLYTFNLREMDSDVIDIALHRSLSVAIGVVWGLFITLFVWPYEARKELRFELSTFLLNLGHYFQQMVKVYSLPPPVDFASPKPSRATSRERPTERSPLLAKQAMRRHVSSAVENFLAMELHLQLTIIRMNGLLEMTRHEPRLKGPFPVAQYKRVLTVSQSLLDQLISMRTVIMRAAFYETVRKDFIIPVNKERREMVGNVMLYFSLLASGLALKAPLPAYLPPAAEARDRLVKKIRTLPVVKRRLIRGGSEGLLYLAYVLTMKDVISGLQVLGEVFQGLFGILGGVGSKEEFEDLFTAGPTTAGESSFLRIEERREDSSSDETV